MPPPQVDLVPLTKCYFKGSKKKDPLKVFNLILKLDRIYRVKEFLLSQCDVEKYFVFRIVEIKVYLKVTDCFLASI